MSLARSSDKKIDFLQRRPLTAGVGGAQGRWRPSPRERVRTDPGDHFLRVFLYAAAAALTALVAVCGSNML